MFSMNDNFLVGSCGERAKDKLAEDYNVEDDIICVNDDVEEVALHKSRIALTVYEVANSYMETADAVVYKSVCISRSLHLNTNTSLAKFQNNLCDNASKLFKEFPDIPLDDI